MDSEIVTARAAAKKSMAGGTYRVLLVFRRVFTKGTFEGVEMVDDLPFVTERDARRWVADVNANHARGSLDYRVADFEVARL